MFDNMSLPFSVGDLISSGGGLLGFVGGFVLLGLAFIFVPAVIYLIRSAFITRSDNKANSHRERNQYTLRDKIRQDVRENRLTYRFMSK